MTPIDYRILALQQIQTRYDEAVNPAIDQREFALRNFAADMKAIRVKAGKKQARVADRMGITASYLSLLESGGKSWTGGLITRYMLACVKGGVK